MSDNNSKPTPEEVGAQTILENFNPSPHGGSWRLNPSQAIRDLIEAGWKPPATKPSPPLSVEVTSPVEVIKGLQGRIDYLKDRHKKAIAGWHRDKREARERIDALSKELVAKHDYILECEQRIIANNALVAGLQDLAEQWRYKGEFGLGPWQMGYGPDLEGQVLDDASSKLRNLLKEARGE